jgi:hypothetical protein
MKKFSYYLEMVQEKESSDGFPDKMIGNLTKEYIINILG